MKNSIFLFLTIALVVMMFSCEKDDDNPAEPSKNYDSVTIGTQVWMAKNLDVDHYLNGDSIPEVRDSAAWANLTTGAWCYYNNNPANDSIYGKLYNWYAVNDPRGLAPANWHIPDKKEWILLINYLGGDYLAAGKIKESGTTNWYPPNVGATNESGFTALPGGWRYIDGSFGGIGINGNLWSAHELYPMSAFGIHLKLNETIVFSGAFDKNDAFSVRCVKD
jgi:uncharacterized protein (TIGR02145 family)